MSHGRHDETVNVSENGCHTLTCCRRRVRELRCQITGLNRRCYWDLIDSVKEIRNPIHQSMTIPTELLWWHIAYGWMRLRLG